MRWKKMNYRQNVRKQRKPVRMDCLISWYVGVNLVSSIDMNYRMSVLTFDWSGITIQGRTFLSLAWIKGLATGGLFGGGKLIIHSFSSQAVPSTKSAQSTTKLCIWILRSCAKITPWIEHPVWPDKSKMAHIKVLLRQNWFKKRFGRWVFTVDIF